MADLVLGPLLRHVGANDATVWVETDEPCEVEVLGHAEPTFTVAGHHYALVCIEGLDPRTRTAYEVSLDGERRWPPADHPFPPSVIDTIDPDRPARILYGSCRVAYPHHPPYTLDKDKDPRGRGHDALFVLARQLLSGGGVESETPRPDLLLLLGDQVYADEVSPQTLDYIRSTRATDRPPGEEVANYEEYTRLYRESWSVPEIRWLLSTIPSAMVIDDHDMHDDWNISRSWVEDMRQLDWWEERVLGGLASYWVYQHLGNLSPALLKRSDLYQRVQSKDDAYEELRQFAHENDRRHEGVQWCYSRNLGNVHLLVIDDRTGRVLEPDRRAIADDTEWEWVVDEARRECDHLVLGFSDPPLLAPALHYAEAWSEAVCAGAWGRRAARLGERARRGLDLDHWSAFGESFERLARLLEEVGSRPDAPASITLLSGDVHHAYLAEVAFRRSAGVRSAVHQAVCSPFRNALDRHERATVRAAVTRPGTALTRLLARAAGAPDPPIRWRVVEGPFFDNQAGTLVLDGREATALLDKTVGRDSDGALERVYERRLTSAA
jgi:PhoD-like phosphatase